MLSPRLFYVYMEGLGKELNSSKIGGIMWCKRIKITCVTLTILHLLSYVQRVTDNLLATCDKHSIELYELVYTWTMSKK